MGPQSSWCDWHLEGGGQRPGHRGVWKHDCEGLHGPTETNISRRKNITKIRIEINEIACPEMLETGLLCHEEEINNSLQQ